MVLAENYGQRTTMFHFDIIWLQSNHLKSNLMKYLYVQVDTLSGENLVTMYNKRIICNFKDMSCSLRLKWYVEQHQGCCVKSTNRNILFNTGQLRGAKLINHNIDFRFFMTQQFYGCVMIIYLIPGNYHLLPRRVIVWVKQILNTHKSMYVLEDTVSKTNEVKSAKTNFIWHDNIDDHVFTEWSKKLSKHYYMFL